MPEAVLVLFFKLQMIEVYVFIDIFYYKLISQAPTWQIQDLSFLLICISKWLDNPLGIQSDATNNLIQEIGMSGMDIRIDIVLNAECY